MHHVINIFKKRLRNHWHIVHGSPSDNTSIGHWNVFTQSFTCSLCVRLRGRGFCGFVSRTVALFMPSPTPRWLRCTDFIHPGQRTEISVREWEAEWKSDKVEEGRRAYWRQGENKQAVLAEIEHRYLLMEGMNGGMLKAITGKKDLPMYLSIRRPIHHRSKYIYIKALDRICKKQNRIFFYNLLVFCMLLVQLFSQ